MPAQQNKLTVSLITGVNPDLREMISRATKKRRGLEETDEYKALEVKHRDSRLDFLRAVKELMKKKS